MAKALNTKDLIEHSAELEATRVAKGRKDTLSKKPFEQLTKTEKELLLKAVAVKLGLIDDSPDQ